MLNTYAPTQFLEKFYDLMVSDNKDFNLTVMLNAFSKIARLVNITCMLPLSLKCFDPNSSDSDTKWLEWFEQKFSSLGGSNQEIDFDEFKKALHIKEVQACIDS